MNDKNKTMRVVIALLITGMLGAGGYGLYRVGMNQGMGMTSSSMAATALTDVTADSAAPAADKKVLYWHDPMVPAQKFDKPGKSPFMDMQLVPVYADGGGDEGTVGISPRMQQNLGIRTAEVTRGALETSVETVGSVTYNDRDVAVVQSRSDGYVERLYVRAVLDPVKKGQPLAELYVREWIAAQEEYLSVRRMSGAGMDGLADATRQRMRLVGMNDAQIAQITRTGKTQARMTVTAPIGGIITELGAREGMTVMSGAPLFRINGLATVWVNAEVPENLAALVRPGSMVEARSPALPGTVFKGKVAALLPEVNATTRTLKARIELANPAGQLLPGMFATLSLAPATSREGLFVPSEAVIRTGTRSVVMVAQAEGRFMPVDVEIGRETNGQSEVRKGLDAGQKVVVSGQFLIDSEASLKGTTTRMGDMPATPPMDKAGDNKAGDTPTSKVHRGQGTVEKIDKDEITLSHGPIPTLQWGAMTMGFKVPAAGLPPEVKVGDATTFDIRDSGDGTYQITTIAPTGETMPDAMSGMAMPKQAEQKASAAGERK